MAAGATVGTPVAEARVAIALVQRSETGQHTPVDLKNLSPRQLDRLALAAKEELQRLRNRKPLAVVRQLLRDAAFEEGYALGEVFPEFTHAAEDMLPLAPAADTAVAESVPATQVAHAASPVPVAAPASPAPATVAADDAAARLVRALSQRGATAIGIATPIAGLMASVGMQDDWSAFHAALESAARRNWIHFRGNDHCVLTDAGFAAAA